MQSNSRQRIFLIFSFISTLILIFSSIFLFYKYFTNINLERYLPKNKILETKVENNKNEKVKIIRIVDGDTIVDSYNNKIRLIGINTPEMKSVKDKCYGQIAKTKTEEMLLGKEVILEKDVSETDKYGRLLRYVWIEDALINNVLIKNGFAQVSTYPPDVKYNYQFIESQKDAQKNKLGFWGEINCK